MTVPDEAPDVAPIGAARHVGPLHPAAVSDPPQAEPAPHRGWRHDVVVFALVVVALELAALPVGLLWGLLAPNPQYQVNGHQVGLVVGDAKPLVRADGLFLLITGAAGVLAAAVVFWRARRAEIGATLGLVAGGLLAGWLAWRVGHDWTGGTQPATLAQQADNTKARLAADVGAHSVLVSWAVAAAATNAILYALTWPAKPKPEPEHVAESVTQPRPWPPPPEPLAER